MKASLFSLIVLVVILTIVIILINRFRSMKVKFTSFLNYLFLVLGILSVIAIVCTIVDATQVYKRDMLEYAIQCNKCISMNYGWLPRCPEFIHGNDNKFFLNFSSIISTIFLLYVVLRRDRSFRFFKFSLFVAILGTVLSYGAYFAHLYIGLNVTPYQHAGKVQTPQVSVPGQIDESDVVYEEEVGEIESKATPCPLVSTYGIGITHWFFHANGSEQYYVAFRFVSANEAQIILPNGRSITLPFARYYQRNETYTFENGTEFFSISGLYLSFKPNPSNKNYSSAKYVGVDQSSASSLSVGQSSGTPSSHSAQESTGSPTQRKCTLCDGKGWRAGNRTTTYGQSEQTYCSECGGYFPPSHSHDRCPSCQGNGYVNY